ncbi:MAG: beta-lactamase domain-containing protein [Parcubacteria group bacterium Athens1014_26]|nr:MAG: beta-lactamase domain-containing protein [Parcubacteria group bacterium Athens1014_26]
MSYPARDASKIVNKNKFMKITKFGHCCLLIEENGARILIDPGSYSTQQNTVKNIDIVIITHNHQDHFQMDSLKAILKNNPQAKIITNKSIGALLEREGIVFNVVENGQSITEKGILIEGFGDKHALIHSSRPSIQNTGYFIANKLFYPGDAFINPQKQIDILALPVSAPWETIAESIDYALELKPKICFPVHDGGIKAPGVFYRIPPEVLEPKGIKFVGLEIDKEYEF